MNNNTIEFYNLNADNYYCATIDADFSSAYKRFLSYIPKNGRIMDMGCGSGRDVVAFSELGYDATGLDASDSMAQLARANLGIKVIVADMVKWISETPFDGVWCCASLVHLHNDEINLFLNNLHKNLRKGGALFVSVKEGIITGYDEEGRYIRNFTREEIVKLLEQKGFEVKEIWQTADKLGRSNLKWINLIALLEEKSWNR